MYKVIFRKTDGSIDKGVQFEKSDTENFDAIELNNVVQNTVKKDRRLRVGLMLITNEEQGKEAA